MMRTAIRGGLCLTALQACVLGTCLVFAHGWIPYATLWPIAAALALVECAYVFWHANKWRPALRFGYLARWIVTMLAVETVTAAAICWCAQGIVFSAVEGALLDAEAARAYKLVRMKPYALVECPGHTEISAWTEERTYLGQGYTAGAGALVGPSFRLPAESPLAQGKALDWVCVSGCPERNQLDEPYLMRAIVSCPMRMDTPVVSKGRLKMPTVTPGNANTSGTSPEVTIVLISGESARSFRSIDDIERNLQDLLLLDLVLWTGFLLGTWTILAWAKMSESSRVSGITTLFT